MSDIMVSISGFEGEGGISGHDTSIRCSKMQMGVDLPVVRSGTARTGGASIHGSIRFTHPIDKASPKLRLAAARATDLGKVVISRTRSIEGAVVAIDTLSISDASVGEIGLYTPLGDGNRPADMPVEVFTLTYSEIQWNYNHYDGATKLSTISGQYSTYTQTTATPKLTA